MSAKSSSTRNAAQRRQSAERSAAARERIARATRRRRLITVGTAVGAVVAVLVALVIVKAATGGPAPKSGQKAAPAQSTVTALVAGVPGATFDAVGAGSSVTPPKALTGAALTSGGQPRVLYVGAEFCPYCAAERWAVAVALSRFGTFAGLGQTTSSPSDVYPSTATLTFHGATFTSRYLSFNGKELQSNQASGNSYANLDSLDSADRTLWQSKGGGYPFVDIGGRWLISGASYNPGLLQGKTQQQIAAQLSQPTSAISQAVVGTANDITAAICTTTGMKPEPVCSSPGVTRAAAKLTRS